MKWQYVDCGVEQQPAVVADELVEERLLPIEAQEVEVHFEQHVDEEDAVEYAARWLVHSYLPAAG